MNEPNDKVTGNHVLKDGSAYSSAAMQPDELHDLFATSSSPEEEDPLAALRDDPNYSALIKELEYIAAQARALFSPAEEAPSDEVWKKILEELPLKPDDA